MAVQAPLQIAQDDDRPFGLAVIDRRDEQDAADVGGLESWCVRPRPARWPGLPINTRVD
jgi:hypothetical protein